MSNTMKQPVETIPEDRSVLFANISFIQNIYDRKSPSQGAGVLHSRFSNDPTIKQLLFSTLFKGNDGKWWKLTDRGNTWWWVQDKSASAPSTSRTATTTQSIDERIEDQIESFVSNWVIKNLPPYLKELAQRNQERNYGLRNTNEILSKAFKWETSPEGKEFWDKVSRSKWLDTDILKVVGSKENLFELPPPVQNTTPTSIDLGPIIGEENVKFDTKKDENLSREFQELAFELGCEWAMGSGVQKLSSPYLYINKKKRIEVGSTVTYFNGSKFLEITIEQIRAQVAAKKSTQTTPSAPSNTTSTGISLGPPIEQGIKFRTKGFEELAIEFQKIMFELGYTWSDGGTSIKDEEKPFWYTNGNTSNNPETFDTFSIQGLDAFQKDSRQEITIEQIRAQVEAKKSGKAPTTATSENLIELLSKKTKVKFDSKGDEKLVELFQKVVFQLGYTWPNSKDRTIQRLDQRYNYAYDDNEIANSNDNVFFEAQTSFIEITEEQLKEAADTLGVDKTINDLIIQLLPKALLSEKLNQIYYINSYRYIEGENEATLLLVLPENRGSDEDYADLYMSFSRAQMEILLNGIKTGGFRVLTQKELQPFGQGDEISINDFIELNESLIYAMKDSTPEVFDAFKEIIDALKEKFPDNVESKKLYVKPTATTKSIDELIDEAKEVFTKSQKIKDLPPYLKELALRNQEKNGQKRNENLSVQSVKAVGGFDWRISNEGNDFWNNVYRREWTSDTVMKVVGSKENFFKLPSSATTKSIDSRIAEQLQLFYFNKIIGNLPPFLKELALQWQELQGNKRNENTRIDGGIFGGTFWEFVNDGKWTSDEVLDAVGSKEKLFELPSSATTTTATPNMNKAWTPQDLVGKYITEGPKVFFVSRLKRNNPKNKAYELYNAETNVRTEWSIGMGAVIKLLDGQSLNNGKYKLVDDPKKTTAQAPTPTPKPTPEPTKTKDPNDYTTWSQEELKEELKDLNEALSYLDEEDDEYIEIKAKINTLELFID